MNRDTLLARSKTTRAVKLDDDAQVTIRKLSAAEVGTLRKDYAGQAIDGMRYVTACVLLDENGASMFNGSIDPVAGLPFDDVQAISNAAMEFSGLGERPKSAPTE